MLRRITLILFISLFSTAHYAAEPVPDDIRYMLEDLYGPDKNEWPVTRNTDLNNDGFSDWLAKKENCSDKKKCPIEIFICIPDKKGNCTEYCYMEVKTLERIKKELSDMKCESTC